MPTTALRPFAFVLLTTLWLANGVRCFSADDGSARRSAEAMPELVRQYQADERSVQGAFGLPGSEAAMQQSEQLQRTWLKRLEAVDFGALDRAGKVDYLLLRNQCQRSLEDVARQRKRLGEIEALVAFRDTIVELEQARREAKPIDSRAAAEKLSTLAEKVKQLRQRVEKGGKAKDAKEDATDAKGKDDADKVTANGKKLEGEPIAVAAETALRAAEVVKQLHDTLERWFKYYYGYGPDFDWWAKQPYDHAHKELEEYGKLLREKTARQKGGEDDPLLGSPIGAEALASDLRFEFLPYTADELIAIGERELAWCEAQMREASRAMGLGDDWKAALAKVKADQMPPGRQDDLIAEIGREATAFVEERKLVSVPPLCQQTWRLTMMSPEELKTIPYAAYGGQRMMVAYAQQSMSEQDKLMVMRGNNRHFMRLVTPHELIPGHHLQGFFAARYNTHRQLFWTPFYVEGWAFYWELRLWELGWAKTPEDRIGMLFWRMTRAARIIVSLKYHLGRMQPDEMVQFLMDRVGHEKLGATSEVRRFIRAAPLYQASYMIGGLQQFALHKELVSAGKMSDEQYHDAVLKNGPMPIELLRVDLLGLPLDKEFKPVWKPTDVGAPQ